MPKGLLDSREYWQSHRWDRDLEHGRAPRAIQAELQHQEEMTVSAVRELASGPNQPLSVLDLPVGTGRIARLLCIAIPSMCLKIGDINYGTLRLARSRVSSAGLKADAVCIDAYDVGTCFPRAFDVVVCLDFLSHVSDLTCFMSSVADSLKPKGLFIANVLTAERFAEYEFVKYGWVKAKRRAILREVSKAFYPFAPYPLRYGIRRWGVARIEGASRETVYQELRHRFHSPEVVSTFYHWFRAQLK
jgi:SAM-dependent methyltransferase